MLAQKDLLQMPVLAQDVSLERQVSPTPGRLTAPLTVKVKVPLRISRQGITQLFVMSVLMVNHNQTASRDVVIGKMISVKKLTAW